MLLLSHFSLSDSVRPHRRKPTRLPRPWDSPGKNTGVGCHFLLQCMKVKSESEVVQLYPTPSTGFSRQEYWSGVPLPSPTFEIIYILKDMTYHYYINTNNYYINSECILSQRICFTCDHVYFFINILFLPM